MKTNTRFKSGISGNEATKWRPGQSGNPAGKSKRRSLFEEAFNEALITEGSPQEAGKLLWEAARAKEPWAIQELCRRFAPETQSFRLVHEADDGTLDYSKLSNEQIQQLEAILEQAGADSVASQNGESKTQLP